MFAIIISPLASSSVHYSFLCMPRYERCWEVLHTHQTALSESFSMTSHIIGGTTKLFNICDVTKKRVGYIKRIFQKIRRLGITQKHIPKALLDSYFHYGLVSVSTIKGLCLHYCEGQSRIVLGLLVCLLKILYFFRAMKCTQQGSKRYMQQQNTIKSFLMKAL